MSEAGLDEKQIDNNNVNAILKRRSKRIALLILAGVFLWWLVFIARLYKNLFEESIGPSNVGRTNIALQSSDDEENWNTTSSSSSSSLSQQARQSWRFVSIPDLLNNDVDYNDSRWEGKMGNNKYGALSFVMESIKAENPDFVAVAGDLVQGRWSLDFFSSRLFVKKAWRRHHIRAMGNRFYGAHVERFRAYGLKLLTVIGDHELGDGGWKEGDMDLKFTSDYRNAYLENFVTPKNGPEGYVGRSYYVRHKNLLFIAVDVFESPDLRQELPQVQETWLREVFRNNSDLAHRVVMAHVPILNVTHMRSSSGLHIAEAGASNFWKVLEEYNVDVYIAGEVHDISIQEQGGVLQVVHGTQMSNVRDVNYMVVDVFEDHLDLKLKQAKTIISGPRRYIFDPFKADNYVRRVVSVDKVQQQEGFYSFGSITIDKSLTAEGDNGQLVNATGMFVDRFTSY